MSETKDPTSIPGGQVKDTIKDTASGEQQNPVNLESVPRSIAGIVNDAGDVLDDAGNIVGKIADPDNLKNLVGNTVNSAGDIVSSTGDVLGKTLPLRQEEQGEEQQEEQPEEHDSHDEEYSEYTTQPAEKKPGGLGLGGKSDETLETPKQAEEAKGQVPQVKPEAQKGTGISIEDRDVPTGDKEAAETQDKLKEVPSEEAKDETSKAEDVAKEVQPEEQKPEDLTKKQPEGLTEQKPEDITTKVGEKVDEQDVPGVPKGAPQDEAPKSEIPEGEAPKSEAPGEEVPGGESPGDEGELKAPVEEAAGELAEEAKEPLDFAVLMGTTVDKEGNLVNEKGHLIGHVIEGEVKQLIGMKCDDQGTIWGDFGKALGKAEPLPEWERGEPKDYSVLKGCKVNGEGNLLNDKGDTIGRVIEGELRQLKGLESDENGKIWSDGKVAGRAEPLPEWERIQKKDYSILKGTKVNKGGNLVNTNGDVLGKVIEGNLKELVGKRADENGDIWNDSGEVVGKGEPVSTAEREDKAFAPFENFPGATVEADGRVLFEGQQVGLVVEGDPKHLKGSKVDEDGDILDRRGNAVGKAKAWEEPTPEPEVEVDKSALAGKRVNKAGNVVSRDGEIFGRVIEGHIGSLVGRMCDKDGNVRSESGDIIGKAELVPEGEREGLKEGPFAELQGCTVSKDGKVVTPSGDVIGRLTSGDPKVLYGRGVDEDGDILDRNGNVIGKAERWEEPVVEKKKDPLAGRRVNREGNVNDEDGNIVGKLTSGDLLICSGKEVDEDGDVVNQKGQTIGHVTKLEDIPPEPEPQPEETPEERLKREQAEQEEAKKKEEAEKDRKLASALAYNIDQTLDKIRPICKMIDDKISACEAQPKEERDEEELVRQVRPLIEEGGKILTETNGIIRGLDPDGRIQRNAKQKAATAEATPEEYRLAELLKELTGSVTTTIDNARRKLEGMPHAKKELNPLWALLAEPLFQIIAGVGLLLSGVLGLVGKLVGPLLQGLGLGGILDGLLRGLALDKILQGLGLGDVVGSLTGKKK